MCAFGPERNPVTGRAHGAPAPQAARTAHEARRCRSAGTRAEVHAPKLRAIDVVITIDALARYDATA